jgi:hypothetical protein
MRLRTFLKAQATELREFMEVLVEYALSKSGELSTHRPDLGALRSILCSYCRDLLPYDDAWTRYHELRENSGALDLLRDIRSVPDNALPPPPVLPALRILGRWKCDHGKNRAWTAGEDMRLLAAIYRFGTDDWYRVSAFVGSGRSKSQCHQRWSRGLVARIVRASWTAEQDEQLLMLVALYGEKCWTRVAVGVGNRCDVQCRYRYNVLKKSDGFKSRFAAASMKVHANPMLAGRLVPLAKAKRRRPKDNSLTQGDTGELLIADEQDEGDDQQSESSRTFEETETSDFDESDG